MVITFLRAGALLAALWLAGCGSTRAGCFPGGAVKTVVVDGGALPADDAGALAFCQSICGADYPSCAPLDGGSRWSCAPPGICAAGL
ncbi:MAG TPA: hypothetical protein VFF06_23645 [Polyangia bacterium]|nr:hypothetical protein [Polyangia bacterium]